MAFYKNAVKCKPGKNKLGERGKKTQKKTSKMMKFVVSMHVGNFVFNTNTLGHDYTVTVGNYVTFACFYLGDKFM